MVDLSHIFPPLQNHPPVDLKVESIPSPTFNFFCQKKMKIDRGLSRSSEGVGRKTWYFGVPTESIDSISGDFGAMLVDLSDEISSGVSK